MKKNKKLDRIKALFKKYLVVILFFILVVPMNVVAYTWGTKNWWIKINPSEISSSIIINGAVYTIKNSNILGSSLFIPTKTLIGIKSINSGESKVNKVGSSCAIPGQEEQEEVVRKDSLNEAGVELSEEDKKAPKIMPELDLTINKKNISPDNFLIALDLPTYLKFISADNLAHEIVFDAPELQEASLSIKAGESQGIVFNIPVPGEYKFHCTTPGHKKETGKMIVK